MDENFKYTESKAKIRITVLTMNAGAVWGKTPVLCA